MKSTANGAFEAGDIGKIDQRRGGLEALQEFWKSFAVEIEPSGARWVARDESIRRSFEKALADQSLDGRFKRSALVSAVREVLR